MVKLDVTPYSDEEIGTMRAMFAEGHTIPVIAAHLGRPAVSLGKKLRWLGLWRRPRKGVRIIRPDPIMLEPEPKGQSAEGDVVEAVPLRRHQAVAAGVVATEPEQGGASRDASRRCREHTR